jgi:hypothetical protein
MGVPYKKLMIGLEFREKQCGDKRTLLLFVNENLSQFYIFGVIWMKFRTGIVCKFIL